MQAPPAYQAQNKDSRYSEATEPLLASAGPSNAFYDQPHDEIPDDFKYGVNVADATLEIRNAFVRKVYSILFVQILLTTVVGGFVSQSEETVFWIQTHSWSLFLGMIASLVNLGVLYWKRHSHPANFIFLGTFTLLEAYTLGFIVAFYNNVIVLQALLITLGIFLGLTLFTLQSKWDFSGMAPFLFGGIIALIMTGFVGMIFPFSKTFEFVYAIGGAVLFSGYIIFDTYMIFNHLSPDEYIMAAINLYLDFVNLFIMILRILNNTNNE